VIYYKRNSVKYCDRPCKNYKYLTALAEWLIENPSASIKLLGFMELREQKKFIKHKGKCRSKNCNYKSVAQSRVEVLQKLLIIKGVDTKQIEIKWNNEAKIPNNNELLRKVEILPQGNQ
jgi:hypothetical protein